MRKEKTLCTEVAKLCERMNLVSLKLQSRKFVLKHSATIGGKNTEFGRETQARLPDSRLLMPMSLRNHLSFSVDWRY